MAVNDEGSRNLDDAARKAMTKLGSKHFLHLGFRYRGQGRRLRQDTRAAPQLTLASVPSPRHAAPQCRPGEWRAVARLHRARLGAQVFLQKLLPFLKRSGLSLHGLVHFIQPLTKYELDVRTARCAFPFFGQGVIACLGGRQTSVSLPGPLRPLPGPLRPLSLPPPGTGRHKVSLPGRAPGQEGPWVVLHRGLLCLGL